MHIHILEILSPSHMRRLIMKSGICELIGGLWSRLILVILLYEWIFFKGVWTLPPTPSLNLAQDDVDTKANPAPV